MDSAEVFLSPDPVKKRAAAQILMGNGVSYLDSDETIKLIGSDIGATHPGTVRFTCREILQDILPSLLDPQEQVFSSWRNAVPENFAAEPALLA
jgi:hypothetical protein